MIVAAIDGYLQAQHLKNGLPLGSGPSSTITSNHQDRTVARTAAPCFDASFEPQHVPENVIAVAVLPDLTRSVVEEHLSELEKLIETAGGIVVDACSPNGRVPIRHLRRRQGRADQSLVAKTGAKLIVR